MIWLVELLSIALVDLPAKKEGRDSLGKIEGRLEEYLPERSSLF